MNKDWTGNTRSAFATLGARTYANEAREENDYYATEPKATELLLNEVKFAHDILEPACGEGHMSKVLKAHGYNVSSYDLIDRGFGQQQDFMQIKKWGGDIITNPPYKYAREFVEHALEIIPDGCKVAMFLKIQFLETKGRRELFEKYPPKTVYVASGRLACAKNGDFGSHSLRAMCYAWYVWEKGYHGDTVLKWIN